MTKKIVPVFGLLALIVNSALAATPVSPGKTKRVYDLTRYDPITGFASKIGTDIVEIDKQGDVTTVKFTTNIKVVVAYVTMYKFSHTAVEIWNGNQLTSFKSQTTTTALNTTSQFRRPAKKRISMLTERQSTNRIKSFPGVFGAGPLSRAGVSSLRTTAKYRRSNLPISARRP